MSNGTHTSLLVEALEQDESFATRGYTAQRSADGILVQRSGHVRGMWTNNSDAFVWTAAGYNEPTFKTTSLPAAVGYTLTEISKF